jgi:hypothetical protein
MKQMPDEPLCSCGHTIGAHYAEPYCPACVGFPGCDLDFAAWLAEHASAALKAHTDAAAGNGTAYADAMERLSEPERDALRRFMLGYLSSRVPSSLWHDAIRDGRAHLRGRPHHG